MNIYDIIHEYRAVAEKFINVLTMRSSDGRVEDVADAIHAHPTLNKVMEAAVRDALREIEASSP